MTNKQHPINSGFNATTTAGQILDGVDLSGITAVITGGHSGLGLETTRALTAAGAKVIVGSRNPDLARTNLIDSKLTENINICQLNLADLPSVRAFARSILETSIHIDIIICSAGIMACPETRNDLGWESQFATNHLGHYALVNLLWPALKGSARVITVSSAGHHQSDIRWNDIQFIHNYDKWLAYGQSKTANALFAVHLDRLGKHQGVRAFSVDPGKIFTPLQRYLAQDEMIAAGWLNADGSSADSSFKTPQQGAATQVWAATSPQLNGLGGLYCEDCEIASVDESDLPSFHGVRSYAIDAEKAERLWTLSANMTGINAFMKS